MREVYSKKLIEPSDVKKDKRVTILNISVGFLKIRNASVLEFHPEILKCSITSASRLLHRHTTSVDPIVRGMINEIPYPVTNQCNSLKALLPCFRLG